MAGLTQSQIDLFRTAFREARLVVVLMLMNRLDKPCNARELSTLLNIDYETTRGYLKKLAGGRITHIRGQGWMLTQTGRQLALLLDENAEKPRSTITTTTLNMKENPKVEVVVIKSAEKPRLLADESAENPRLVAVWQALTECGIEHNHTTDSLASQPWMTPHYIARWKQHLENRGKSMPQWAGLLIQLLAAGKPAPGCSGCYECQAIADQNWPSLSWYLKDRYGWSEP